MPAIADVVIEKRFEDLERIVHEQAFALEDQNRRLSLLEIADVPPSLPATEELTVRPAATGTSVSVDNAQHVAADSAPKDDEDDGTIELDGSIWGAARMYSCTVD